MWHWMKWTLQKVSFICETHKETSDTNKHFTELLVLQHFSHDNYKQTKRVFQTINAEHKRQWVCLWYDDIDKERVSVLKSVKSTNENTKNKTHTHTPKKATNPPTNKEIWSAKTIALLGLSTITLPSPKGEHRSQWGSLWPKQSTSWTLFTNNPPDKLTPPLYRVYLCREL